MSVDSASVLTFPARELGRLERLGVLPACPSHRGHQQPTYLCWPWSGPCCPGAHRMSLWLGGQARPSWRMGCRGHPVLGQVRPRWPWLLCEPWLCPPCWAGSLGRRPLSLQRPGGHSLCSAPFSGPRLCLWPSLGPLHWPCRCLRGGTAGRHHPCLKPARAWGTDSEGSDSRCRHFWWGPSPCELVGSLRGVLLTMGRALPCASWAVTVPQPLSPDPADGREVQQ